MEQQRRIVAGDGGAPGALTLSDVVAFFRRNLLLIGGAALVSGLVVGAVVLIFVRKGYEASATLVIVPSRFSSELKPQTLTVKSYQTLLESDAVIADTKKQLVLQGVYRSDKPLRLGRELETRIFVARRAEEVTLAPMLQAVARGANPDQAAAIANTWAQVFLGRARDVIAGTTSSTVQFIDQQYPAVRDALAKLENAQVQEADALQKGYNDTATSGDQRLSAFKKETTRLVAEYQVESRRLQEEFAAQHNMDSREAQLSALRAAYADLQQEQARVTSQLQLKQLQLEAVRKQLAETPQLLTLKKAMTDDALWRTTEGGARGNERTDWKALQDRTLVTQEVNPIFTSLSGKLADTEMEVNALAPRASGMTVDLQRIDAEMKEVESSVRSDRAAFEGLRLGREAGLSQLTEKRATELTELTRVTQAALDACKREMDNRRGQSARMIAQQQGLFDQLAKSYNQAILAKGQEEFEDVRLGAPAVPPEQPRVPRGAITKSAFATILGGLLGLVVALVREAAVRPA